MNFLQGKNGMERASFDAVWPHLPCLPSPKEGALGKNLKKGPCIREGSMDLDIKYGEESLSKWIICYICFHTAF